MNTKDKASLCARHNISVASYEAGCWMCATDELLDNYNYRYDNVLYDWMCKSCDKPITAKWTNFLERSPPTCCDETYHLKMLEEADF
ncbi:MAG: hypothetical protein QF535_03550 [Anaerolineales bacterium]|jgi:hypothetical protein|nr:hypothetical protein [Anaerolineales bacterium]|tara:strand:- start:7693 stop:7953 length:261 start_codon:yes stop_codon:yes gene_type:complete